MRRRITACLVAVSFFLMLTGCAAVYHSESDAFKLYGLALLSDSGGQDAISYVSIPWKSIPEENQEEQIAFIVGQIINDCTDKEYRSPVPKGTMLKSVALKSGVATVDFSSNYGNLSGIDLTLADYCISFSLTQLPNVNSVRITVNGKDLDYRSSKVIYPSNALLSSTEDIIRTFHATIFYLDENGQLAGEDRVLEFFEGENRAEKVVEAMMGKSENSKYVPLLSEDFSVLTIRIEDGVCHINIPGNNATLFSGKEEQSNAVNGIRSSILSLDGVNQVEFYLDGEHTDQFGLATIPQE